MSHENASGELASGEWRFGVAVTAVVPSYDPATAWNRFWLANCHLFISHTACCISAFYGMAFQNVALNMLILADKTCSDKETFRLDFISYTELLAAESMQQGIFWDAERCWMI